MAVAGHSMEPALREGDWLLVLPVPRRLRSGDVVVVRDPREPARCLLKRIAEVRDDEVVVLGDHVEHSTDSRAFGPVRVRDVIGRAAFRYAPRGRIGLLARA